MYSWAAEVGSCIEGKQAKFLLPQAQDCIRGIVQRAREPHYSLVGKLQRNSRPDGNGRCGCDHENVFARLPMVKFAAAMQDSFAKLFPVFAAVGKAPTNPRLYNFRIARQPFAMNFGGVRTVADPHLLEHFFVFAAKVGVLGA